MTKKIEYFIDKVVKSKIMPLMLFFFIVSIGFLLRSKPYLQGNFNYFLDQSRDLLLTKQIVVDHRITLIGARAGIAGVFHGPLWLYMIAPFFYLAKGNPFYTLVPLFLIINLLPILLAYFAGTKLYDKSTGFIWSFCIAISSTLIEPSFITSNAQVMPILFLSYLALMLLYMRGKEISFVFVLLLIGLAFQFESAFAIFLIPLTIFGVLLFKKIPPLKSLLLGSLLMILSVSNFIIFELRHKFLMTHSAYKLFDGSIKPFSDYKQLANIGFRVYDRILGLINYFFTPLFQHNTIINLLVLFVLLSAIFLLLKKIKSNGIIEKKDKEYIFILSIPFLYYLLYILYPFPLWGQYTLALSVSASLLLGLSIKRIHDKLNNKIFLCLLMLILALPSLSWIYVNYFGRLANKQEFKNYKEQMAVANYIFKDNPDKNKVGYFVYDSGSLTYNMDYLMWYLGKKYDKEAVNEKLPITYLILNSPPKWNSSDRNYWIENVIKTNGHVLTRKRFSNEMIVEKRAIPKNEPPPDANYFQNRIFR